jgi:hypothetical protein
LRATVGTSNDTALEVQSYALGDLKVPIDAPLGLVLIPPGEPDAMDALVSALRNEPRKTEVLWLANGDKLTGGFLGLGPQKVAFQPEAGKVDLDRNGVVAVGFDPTLTDYPLPKGEFLELTLTDGSRLGVTGPRVEKGQVAATTRFGAKVRVPLADLARVHARGPHVTYLSDLDPAGDGYEGYVGPTRPYRRDLTVEGHPLRLAGQSYDRGLGTQSRTVLGYRLRPGDRWFQALVGLDDRAGPLGSVVFRVLVDKVEKYKSPPMSARDTPRPVDVDVRGGKGVILITEFGERGDVRDVADWVEARLVGGPAEK